MTTYRYLASGWIEATYDTGSSSTFPPADDNEHWLAIKDDVASGAIVIAPYVLPGQSFAAREREESETALRWAPDDTQKLAALTKLTYGGV